MTLEENRNGTNAKQKVLVTSCYRERSVSKDREIVYREQMTYISPHRGHIQYICNSFLIFIIYMVYMKLKNY